MLGAFVPELGSASQGTMPEHTGRPRRALTPAAQKFKQRHPGAARVLERLVMWPYRRRIRRDERVRLEILEQTIQTCRTQYAKCQEQGLVDTAAVFNAALYVLLFDRDFGALKEFFLVSDNDWNRQVVGRQMAIMLYEGVKDLSNLFGQQFRAILADNEVSEVRRVEMDTLRSRLASFRHQHAKRLNELRNVMAAHRDKNAMAQLRIVDSLHPLEVYETSVEFWAVIRDLTPVLTGIISEIAAPRQLLRQMGKRRSTK